MPAAPTNDPPRILIVRPSALGDVARTVPALVSLRRAYPDAVIDWLVSRPFIPAIQHHPALSAAVAFDRAAKWPEQRRLMRRLRDARYTHAFDLQGLARSGAFTWATRARERHGFRDARELAWLGYHRRHRHRVEATHTVDRMLGLLESTGVEPVHDMRLYASAQALGDAAALGAYTLLAPTAQWRCKCWPVERYAALAQRLRAHWPGRRVVVTCAPNERDALQPLADLDPAGDWLVFPGGGVDAFVGLVAKASLVVCNDSAAAHLAVGFDRPLVCVMGPTDPALVGPYRRPDAVVQPPGLTRDDMTKYRQRKDDDTLIAGVTLNAVWDVVRREADAPPSPA